MGILATIERRASLENPSTSLANPAAWLIEAMGGEKTAAGARINEDNALDLSAVWAALRVLANVIAVPSLPVYERLERGKRRAPEHPLTRVLDVAPNPETSAIAFRRTLMCHIVLYGNAFAEIEYDGAQRPIALWPLLPDRTRALRRQGRKFIVTRIAGDDIPLAAERVLHIPGEQLWDGMNGRGLVRHARESLGLTKATEEFGARFFGSGARASGILTHPRTLSPEAGARLAKRIQEAHSGLSNSQRMIVLEEGTTWAQNSIAPEDSQFLETRKLQVTEVARFFGVPPHMIYDMEKATYTNIEQQQIAFFVQGALGWYRTWEQELNRQLFRREEQERFYAKFLHQELLRGDSTARAAFYQSLFNMGAISPNEIRELENMNPIEDGDSYFVQLNLTTLENAGQVAEPMAAPTGNSRVALRAIGPSAEERARRSIGSRRRLHNAQRRVFAQIAERVLAREIKAIRRLVERARSTSQLVSGIESFYRGMPPHVRDAFGPALLSFMDLAQAEVAREVGGDSALTPEMRRHARAFAASLGARYAGVSMTTLTRRVAELERDEAAAAAGAVLDNWEEVRVRKVSRSEAIRAGGSFARLAYVHFGVTQLRWVALGSDKCPFCRQLDGRVVGVEDSFAGPGDVIEGGGKALSIVRSVLHPPIHGGCTCMISAG